MAFIALTMMPLSMTTPGKPSAFYRANMEDAGQYLQMGLLSPRVMAYTALTVLALVAFLLSGRSRTPLGVPLESRNHSLVASHICTFGTEY